VPADLTRLQAIFREVFGRPDLVISPATTVDDVEGWDSFANINLLFAIESAYGIRFALGELQALAHVGELAALIGDKIGRVAPSKRR
jgi:acyl carrier protein